MEMRLRTPVTRGYFFLLGALRLVNAASPRTISVHKKKISSGTQGIAKEARYANFCCCYFVCLPFFLTGSVFSFLYYIFTGVYLQVFIYLFVFVLFCFVLF